jgi:hypothetical protein
VRQLTQRVRDQIQRPSVFLYHLGIQSSEVEPVEDVVVVYFGKVFLLVSGSPAMTIVLNVQACDSMKGGIRQYVRFP